MLFLLHSLCPSSPPPLIPNPTEQGWGCSLLIYYPHLCSRTPLGLQSPFWTAPGRKIVSRKQESKLSGRGAGPGRLLEQSPVPSPPPPPMVLGVFPSDLVTVR